MFMSEGFQGLGQGWMMCHGGHIWSSSTYLARYAAYVTSCYSSQGAVFGHIWSGSTHLARYAAYMTSCYSSQGALFGHFDPHSHRLAHIVVTRSL